MLVRWLRVGAGSAAAAGATIDWAPQAETSQFRAPVSRDRLGLLSYKIPPLFFSHLPKSPSISHSPGKCFQRESLRFRVEKHLWKANTVFDCVTTVAMKSSSDFASAHFCSVVMSKHCFSRMILNCLTPSEHFYSSLLIY